jgi:hypothetical protein
MSKTDVSHYYELKPDGSVVGAYGATLKEARERKLYASATMALKSIANVGLDIWIRGNLLDSVIENPKGPLETVESYKERINGIADERRIGAANFGTALHNALEHYPLPCNDPEVAAYYDACVPWLKANVSEVLGNEVMLADPDIGFAGKTDMVYRDHAGIAWIVDFKSNTFKKTKTGRWAKPSFYSSWVRQLAFYARCWQKKYGELPRVVSLAINSVEPTEPVAKFWTIEEQEQGMDEFLCAAYLYSCEKDHWPSKAWRLTETESRQAKDPIDVQVNLVE